MRRGGKATTPLRVLLYFKSWQPAEVFLIMFLSGIGSRVDGLRPPPPGGSGSRSEEPGPLTPRPRYQGGRGGAAARGSGSRASRGAASAPPGPAPGRPQRTSSARRGSRPGCRQRAGRGGSAARLSRGVPRRAKLRRPAWPPAVVRGDAAGRGAQSAFKKATHPETNSPPLPSESSPTSQELCLHRRVGAGRRKPP